MPKYTFASGFPDKKEKIIVKCIKDTIGCNIGDVYEEFTSWYISSSRQWFNYDWKNWTEYFQEVKEEEVNKPRWKVGDYVVTKNEFLIQYIKISRIKYDEPIFVYEWEFTEGELRDPKQEELKIYFR